MRRQDWSLTLWCGPNSTLKQVKAALTLQLGLIRLKVFNISMSRPSHHWLAQRHDAPCPGLLRTTSRVPLSMVFVRPAGINCKACLREVSHCSGMVVQFPEAEVWWRHAVWNCWRGGNVVVTRKNTGPLHVVRMHSLRLAGRVDVNAC